MPSDTSSDPRDVASLPWGFAEATLFFVVPDVWISHVAIRHGLRAGVAASLRALAGALLGGVVMHAWGRRSPQTVRAIFVRLPAIDAAMVAQVDADVRHHGAVALLSGPLRGRPYKLYAVAAGAQGHPMRTLLLWSVPGRLARFLLSAAGAAGARHLLRRRVGRRGRTIASWCAWAVFYALMWTVGPGRGAAPAPEADAGGA